MNTQLYSLFDRAEQLRSLLSYHSGNGWISAEKFSEIKSHRFSLAQARDYMSVVGAFCWLKQNDQTSLQIAAPLVYIAYAESRIQAQKIHRLVWSQGLVPFLIVVTSSEIIICEGFRYERESWNHQIQVVSWDDVKVECDQLHQALRSLNAQRLRASLFWREHALDVSGRVDLKLLDVLDDLSQNLIQGKGVSHPISYQAANSLIGKMLYVQFLIDRGIIDQKWLDERGHEGILATGTTAWDDNSFWALIDDLDSIFNGSVFPISKQSRHSVDGSHLLLVRSVLKHGAIPLSDGSVQLCFIDIDLSVLRVETLAAVYEQFLENVGNGERRRVGAYYTRPFLVDVVLDQIEEKKTLSDGVKVLDPAAGSGVFLVGAYRRMLEKAQAQGSLSLEHVRNLLIDNIYGVERNPDACHVAAFSLYLTMLDYINPRELRVVSAGNDQRKLFPSLVGINLINADFFAKEIKLPKIDCAIGNPPWQKISELGSECAIDWRNQNKKEAPIGQDQAAELFVWKVLLHHLNEGGVMAMLIPAKSFVNPTARQFRDRLTREFRVFGAINFSHMRHRLFAGAKHACAGVFVSKDKPVGDEWTWVYSPLSISQPVSSREDWPWTFVVNRSEVEYFRQEKLCREARAWFEAFVLRPVDRHIHAFIDDKCTVGDIGTLGHICDLVGASIRRGGNSSETGLNEKYIDVVEEETSINGVTNALFDDFVSPEKEKLELSCEVFETIKPAYRDRFFGDFVLVPRNFRNIKYVDHPKAYSSSYIGIFFSDRNGVLSGVKSNFLKAISKYLCTDVAMYFMATKGRRWLMDRGNVEPNDLSNLPCPVNSLNDDNIEEILNLEGSALEDFIFNVFNLSDGYKRSIEEFIRFRFYFKDGNVPPRALSRPSQSELSIYSRAVKDQLDELVGEVALFKTRYVELEEFGVCIFVAQFIDGEDEDDMSVDEICENLCSSYQEKLTNSFYDSLAISKPVPNAVTLTKPLEYFRWTLESAYSDSRQIIEALMATGGH